MKISKESNGVIGLEFKIIAEIIDFNADFCFWEQINSERSEI